MKIAWFTPFNKRSAIGNYSKHATEAISRWNEVDIYVNYDPNEGKEELYDTPLKIKRYEGLEVVNELNDYDICVYNMGDNAIYHSAIYEVLKVKKGIVIAHDICMHNFIVGYNCVYKKQYQEYLHILEKEYGEEAVKFLSEALKSSDEWKKIDFLKYNMLRYICGDALGIVVHSKYHESYIKEVYKGPVLTTPLLCMNEWEDDENSKERNNDIVNFLTVGMVNSNKHIDLIVKVIGKNKILREKVRYYVVGASTNKEYFGEIKKLIKYYNLENNVFLLGYVDDEEMGQKYKEADAIINLRYPALEGGSASLVEQMLDGKCIVVINTGVYSEIPDECVCKIEPNNMEMNLEKSMLEIVENSQLAINYGMRAKTYAKLEFSEESYGNRMNEFLEEVAFSLPLYEVVQKCNDTLQCMKRTNVERRLVREMIKMFSDI